ncbi:MAG: carbohydrate ABC transporter substrate-binding protein, partial [Chloroflexota bacterium]|nr:carbohydrate ABC transporter substrate-binding protein [Chloroflexota bacterium]
MSKATSAAFTRRGFLGLAGSSAAMAALAACAPAGGGGGGSGAGKIEFWNMPWGGTAFNPLDEEITLAYEPAEGLPDVDYQAIQWQNWLETFATATASNTGPAV